MSIERAQLAGRKPGTEQRIRQISFAVSDIQTVEILRDKCEHGARLAVVSLAAEAEASRKHNSTIPYAWVCSACGEETRDQSSAISLIRTMIQATARGCTSA